MEENKPGLIRRLLGFLTAIIIGGAIGSILGLTLAPRRGKETREYLKERSYDFYTKGRSIFSRENKKVGLLKRLLIKALMPKKNEDNDSL